MWKAEVRLINASFAYDRPWTYISHTFLEKGSLVALPFGKADRWQYGIVTKAEQVEDFPQGLKEISFVLPSPYKLSETQLSLCEYMSEHTFSPFGECARVMLPSGLSFKTVEYFEQGEKYELWQEKIPLENIQSLSPKEINSLIKNKYILKKTKAVSSVNVKSETFVSLVKNPPLDTLSSTRKKEEYIKVVSYLEGTSEVSLKELLSIYSIDRAGIKLLEKKGIVKIFEKRVEREAYDFTRFEKKEEKINLSPEQQEAFDKLFPLYNSHKPSAALIWGVTGSGKTSVILSLIDRAVEEGRGVILLVPEIALTLQNASKLFARYGDKVSVIHSAMSEGQRQDAWEALEAGRKTVVLGTRSAVFAPIKNLGMIVIDEEQDQSYKSDVTPRYHARDVARFRCTKENAFLLLSSATPDIETYYKAEKGKFAFVKLSERFGGATLPDITLFDTIAEGLPPDTMIGEKLEEELRKNLEKGEQSILFLNRRGLRKLLVCRDCKTGVSCPNCSVPMTLHLTGQEYKLVCHYCGYKSSPPDKCPTCSSRHMQYRGYGTEKLEEELRRRLPQARVLRMDADTTSRHFSHDEIIEKFARKQADILIGTQMVTKGHNFPDVTLVGVVMADLSLMVSDYRASENTFALLTQVVGRAGRADKKGRALIQTSDSGSELINLCTTQDYESFYKGEIALRRALMFPPFCTVGMFFLSSESELELERAAEKLSDTLASKLGGEFSDVKLLAYGPFEAFPYKLKNKYRRKLVLKYANTPRTRKLIREVLLHLSDKGHVHCIFDPSPTGI